MNGFGGTTALLRLAGRRDRVIVPVSVLALTAFVAGSARATTELYPDVATASTALATTLENPALVAMYGPVSSLTLDAFATFKSVLLGAVFLCLLAFVVVRRHTRTEEEAGRLELLGAGAVGRRAALGSAVILGTAAVLATALLTSAASIAVGLDPAGSVALGVAWTIIGLSWVGITAVSAQLTESARGTAGFAVGALGIAFLLRAVADTAGDASPLRHLVWLSPLGWGERVAPYGANRVGLLALGLIAYAVLLAAAFALQSRRDLGSGVLASRPGPARGTLTSVGALNRRLVRGTVLGWAVAFGVLGLALGSIAGSVEAFVDSPETLDLLRAIGGDTGSVVDLYFATELHIVAVVSAALGIVLVNRIHTEEVSGRAEALLAGPVPRLVWARGLVVAAVVSPALVLTLAAALAGVVDGLRTGDVGGSVARLVLAAWATLPAVWVCVAVAVLLVGHLPDLTGLAWAALIAFFVVGEFGDLLGLPAVVRAVSPFSHLSALPGGRLEVLPLVVLVAIAVAAGVAGLAGLSRRDLRTD